jgi:hypothetical protein
LTCTPLAGPQHWIGRINRLSAIDRVTGEPLRRYEHPHPGALIHVDVTKLATSPTVAATNL